MLLILQSNEDLWNIILFTKVTFTTIVQALHYDVICVLLLIVKEKARLVNKSLMAGEVKAKQLRKVTNFYNELHDFIRQFSGFYSWQILLTFLACFLNLLYVIGFKMLHNDDERIAGVTWTLVASVSVFHSLMGPFVITFCCDTTKTEFRKIFKICYNLEQSAVYTNEDKKELKLLVEQFTTDPPVFTAAGFFEINRSNLMSFFSSTAMYVLVIIQLRNQ
ncbi:unnamed protein product [Acanthoscelides obtectus]|uniref:Uncharacterized protein n=1 Tax=Acanthoscelides obtectus TaxID=200917 RepID=A0A9P0MG82_ACAOB|nr:unnamed protein product [Acanthoscelides obtectus]CAK1623159.1 hypothetical protein AOBTE_LOCUS1843 [Acanthoscelides obtectus]